MGLPSGRSIALLRRYRIDGRLPPGVYDLYASRVRLAVRARTRRLLATLLPPVGWPHHNDRDQRQLGGRRVPTHGPLDRPLTSVAAANAERVVAVLRSAGIRPFVVDADAHQVQLGIEFEHRAAALETLTTSPDLDAWLLEWRAGRRSGIRSIRRARRSRRVRRARSWRLARAYNEGSIGIGNEQGVVIGFWVVGASGQRELVGTRGDERYDPRAEPTTVDWNGTTLPGLSAFPIARSARFLHEPVDFVITWVDGDDPAWRRQQQAAASGASRPVQLAALDAARFRSRDELRYLLRSIWRNCGWVRRIHLVTAGQRPQWLVEDHRLRVVDHSTILPASALPTFNSHAIEAALHNIPGLAEHYVYLNDDMCIARPVGPECFFTASGLPRVFSSRSRVPAAEDTETQHVDTAARRGQEVLRAEFGRVVEHKPLHAGYALRRSLVSELEAKQPDLFAATMHSTFRSRSDISVSASLAGQYALLSGRGVWGSIESEYVHVESGRLDITLDRLLLGRDRDSFCLNETRDAGVDSAREARIERFYEEYFPSASPWETPR